MFVLFGIACCIMATTVGVFLYGLTLPDTWEVSETIQIEAPVDEVASYIAEPSAWTEWSMWSRDNDPSMEISTSGPNSGPKATLNWAGRRVGRGKLVITKIESGEEPTDPRIVHYELHRYGELFSDQGQFKLVPQGSQTAVTWSNAGELGSTTARLFRSRFTSLVARDYARCLAQLKELVESNSAETKSQK